MILFKCDRCGSAISSYVFTLPVAKFSNADYACRYPVDIDGDQLLQTIRGMHLCADCIEQIGAYIMNYNTKPTEEPKPTPEPAPEAPETPQEAQEEPKKGKTTAKQKERDKRIIELYESGMTVPEIAKEIGKLSPENCRNILKRAGVYKGRPNVDDGKIKALHRAGWPVKEIAGEMKLTEGQVYYYLNQPAKKRKVTNVG